MRLIAAILGFAASVLGVLGTAEVVAAPPTAASVYSYEFPHHAAPTTYAHPDRGPPADYNAGSRHAGDLVSRGASARMQLALARSRTNYDDPAPLEQVAQIATTTPEQALDSDGTLSAVVRGGVAAKSADEFVDLASDARTTHILYGDAIGGGHLWPGLPGRTPFPKDWSADRVMHELSDVATDPNSIFRTGRGGNTVVTGTQDGVYIQAILRNGDIVTGHPTNLPRNP